MQHSANTSHLHKGRTRNNLMLNTYTDVNFLSFPNDIQRGQVPINQKYIDNIVKINNVSVLRHQRAHHFKNNNLEVKQLQNRKYQQQLFFKHAQYDHLNSNLQQTNQIKNSLERKINKVEKNVSDKYLPNTILQKSKNSQKYCNVKLDSNIDQKLKTNVDKNKLVSMSQAIKSNTQTNEKKSNMPTDDLISNIQNDKIHTESNELKMKNKTEEDTKTEVENQENLNNSSLDVKDVTEKDIKSTREKTPMCLINDLARFNKISFQYRLTSERGPPHCKRFTVTLELGDEEYTAEEYKIKKAQHLAAKEAIEKTKYKHPIPKTNKNDDKNIVKSNITPTVELNALAMKLGQQTYYIFDPNQMDFSEQQKVINDTSKSNFKIIPKPFETEQPSVENCSTFFSKSICNSKQLQTLNQSQSIYSKYQNHCLPIQHCTQNGQSPKINSIVSTYFSPISPCKITLIVGSRKFEGCGRTLQQAKHNAASNALQVLKQQINAGDKGDSYNETSDDNYHKSPISLVFEIGIKRNLPVDFKVLREEGPAHMRTFITACIVGDIMTEGEGTGKKISKKRAAQKMLEELKKLPQILPVVSPMKKVKLKIASKKNINTQTKAFNLDESEERTDLFNKIKKSNNEVDSANPITKLLEWHQNRKEKDPVFKLISECGKENSRRRQFVMEVSSNNIVVHGVGHNKKIAKRDAAQNFLNALSEGDKMYSISSRNNLQKDVTSPKNKQCRETLKCISKSKTTCIHKEDEAIYGLKVKETSGKKEIAKGRSDYVNSSPVQEVENSSNTSILSSTSPTSQSYHMKDQLLYLAKLLGFEVEFSDYPKGNHNEYLTIVMLSTNPPQICHGVGLNSKESQEDAAKNALKILSEMGLNNAVKA
ncbi:double-stranded RNA-binding protein Staufen isoform 2-T2 [Cochliomyia hominivorax]